MGEPQKVENSLPGRMMLLNPKSAILILLSASNSKFSGFKSL